MPLPQSDAAVTKSKPLILLIEDNHDLVHYLHICLQKNYRIEAAYDPKQGIRKAFELIPDLIVSDVMMPYKDGFELCHALKSDERTSHIPVVLLTAKADIESRLTGLRRGADAYLTKPFHQEELLTRIHNLLQVREKLHAYYRALSGMNASLTSVTPALPEQALEHAFIQKVRDVIEADFSVQWKVPKLAGRLFVSESQLYRKLEALTGMHPTEFVRHVRLTNVGRLLLGHPNEKISALAHDVGFENINEFNRRFKEMFGMSPGQWRKQNA